MNGMKWDWLVPESQTVMAFTFVGDAVELRTQILSYLFSGFFNLGSMYLKTKFVTAVTDSSFSEISRPPRLGLEGGLSEPTITMEYQGRVMSRKRKSHNEKKT